jgi:para-nitrobenzyl esterase
VPLITGGNADEFGRPQRREGAPATIAAYRSWLREAYGAFADRIFEAYPAPANEQVGRAYYRLIVDNNFAGHRTWVRLHAMNARHPAWLYLFKHAVPRYDRDGTPVRRGAPHGAEIVYVLNNLRATDAPWTAADRALADQLSTYWVNFAANGDPNAENVPRWPAYAPDTESVMQLDDPIEMGGLNAPGLDAIAEHVAARRRADGVR